MRRLSSDEVREVTKFVLRIKPDDLQDKYIDDRVKDGNQMKIVFTINGRNKTIYVSNVYQQDLGGLVALINAMFSEVIFPYKKNGMTEMKTTDKQSTGMLSQKPIIQ